MAQSALYSSDGLIHTESNALVTVIGDATFSGSTTLKHYGTMNVLGDWTDNTSGGVFTADSGSVRFNGSALQTLNGSTEFFKLIINNPAGVTIQSGENKVRHTLTLTSGLLTTNDSLYLVSDADRTARVAKVTGGSAAGDFIIERYIPYAGNNWRMLSIPVQSGTLEQWNDDFVTSGFTGSQYPSFSFTSIYFYNESTLGTADQGFEGATNITNTVSTGGGAWAYIGPLPATVDVKGEINTGTVNYPVTYTDDPTEAADQDGWNQVGNPYPSAIDWDASLGWTKTNLNNAIYVWDGELDQYQSYVDGVGTNGGISEIASMQSFFVQSNAANPALASTEDVKISEDVAFVNRPEIAPNLFRMSVEAWGLVDEAVVRFDRRASHGFDPHLDACEVPSRNSYAPSLASRMGADSYSINTVNPEELNPPIAIELVAGWPGMHSFSITEVPVLPNSYCLYLEDLETGEHYPLDSGISFSVFADTGAAQPRFLLHSYRPLNVSSQSPVCHDDSNASISFSPNAAGSWTLAWYSSVGKLLFAGSADSLHVLSQLKAGNYKVIISDSGSCGMMEEVVTIAGRDSLWLIAEVDPAFAQNALGSVRILPQGGVKPHYIEWTNPRATVGPSLELVPSDTYHLEVTDAVGCKVVRSVWLPEFTNETTGLEESNPQLIIYPNPSQGILHIENRQGGSLTVTLRDMLGRIVHDQKLIVSESQVNLRHLPDGVYYLKVESDEGFMHSSSILIQSP